MRRLFVRCGLAGSQPECQGGHSRVLSFVRGFSRCANVSWACEHGSVSWGASDPDRDRASVEPWHWGWREAPTLVSEQHTAARSRRLLYKTRSMSLWLHMMRDWRGDDAARFAVARVACCWLSICAEFW